MTLAWWLYLVAVVLLVLAALGVGSRVSLAYLAAALLVFTYFVLPALT